MTKRRPTFPYVDGPRHAARWYVEGSDDIVLQPGDRFFLPCEGGPCMSRLEIYPPRLEIDERDGMYVLVDDGPRSEWHYTFVPREP